MQNYCSRTNTAFVQLNKFAILRLFGASPLSEELLVKALQVVVTAREGVSNFIFRKKEFFSNLKKILGDKAITIEEISKSVGIEETFTLSENECEVYADILN